ncbi:MAG: dihydrolipoyllysine acetyltransferase [Gammaproteobacteria bacterium TMED112]|nr:MAG: dihydrolipoyllysine acetyltransferase [Gammaproteobacteria bacterium TMED112]|tara:strand:- start:13 stop:1230 length:1218 start_codon:yes stop_codon:yes gene_type:complete
MKIDLKIPNLGEAEDTEIIEVAISKGEKIKKNDPLIVLESEKAAMEVPADYDGVIISVLVKEGESVSEGKIFATLEVNDAPIDKDESQPEKIKVEDQVVQVKKEAQQKDKKFTENLQIFGGINSGPAVRKISRELGIDLTKIKGTGKNGFITKDDVKNFIQSLSETKPQEYAELSDLENFGDFTLENQSKIRKAGAKNLYNSWSSIPHVTHFEEVDVTNLEKHRKILNDVSKNKISLLAYIVKACSIVLLKRPIINSTLVGDGKLMLKKYVNIGIAVNTDQGLIVPVIRNVEELNLGQISEKINELADKARRKILMEKDLKGATFTISSLGAIGGTGFTPIINPPEVGILGVSRSKKVLQLLNNETTERLITPLALSYDHRVVNGVDAGEFMQEVKYLMENYHND